MRLIVSRERDVHGAKKRHTLSGCRSQRRDIWYCVQAIESAQVATAAVLAIRFQHSSQG
jgi:hypothetical protein